ITISGNEGADAGAGLANGGVLQQSTVAFAAGACPGSGWSAWGAVDGQTPSGTLSVGSTYSVTATVTGGLCYRYRYVATDNVGNVETETSVAIVQGGAPPANLVAPAISDSQGHAPPFEGDTLNATQGTWSGDNPITYTYQWQSCGYKAAVLNDNPVAYWR